MAIKFFEVEQIGTVRVNRASRNRNVRLSITASGEIRVTIPSWSPYQSGIDFARSKSDWILNNLPEKDMPLHDGQRIGKAHRLVYIAAAVDNPSARIIGTEIRITRPIGMAITHPLVQKSSRRAAVRALRNQSEALLPKRLNQLAADHGFEYNSVSVKQLKGRWGSCDNKQDIVLNLYLMQLPWQLIDYVLLHELIHTVHLNHSADFWAEFTRREPFAKQLRKSIKLYKPVLMPVIP